MYRRAFTLIELLIVVAILALLVSILVSALARAKELTKAGGESVSSDRHANWDNSIRCANNPAALRYVFRRKALREVTRPC